MEQIQAQLAQLIAAQQQQHVAMQQQQADNLALRNELVNAQQVAEDARQQSAALATQLAASTSAPSSNARSFDSRQFGKPETFDGSKGWREWSIVMRAYIGTLDPTANRWLKWAEEHETPLLCLTHLNAEQTAFSTRLYYALIMTCRGPAMNRVTNAGDGEGLEAWRQLVKHHEPNTKTRVAGMLLGILSHDFSGNMSERFETFDRDIRKYEELSGDKISENMKVGVIMKQLPAGSLKEHLLLQADRFKTAQENS
jgi:hypothetical protein